MSDLQLVLDVVKRLAVEEASNQGVEMPEEIGTNTPLYGNEGLLDSMGLVTLLVSLEQEIADHFGVSVGLADEKALSQKHSPFRTVESLAAYACGEIEAARGH